MTEQAEFQTGDLVGSKIFEERVKHSGQLMEQSGLDAILLTKPQNMTYLVGNGRLCAFAIIAKNGATYVGVPKTDVEDMKKGSSANHIIGFEDEVGMLHSLMHIWKELKLETGKVGVENTFLRVSMLDMLKHPHAKPDKLMFTDATELMTELRIIKSSGELEKIRKAGKVADKAMEAAISALGVGVKETEIAGEAEYSMRKNGAEEFFRTYVASGPRTSIAHGVVSNRRLQEGDLVMIDLHPTVEDYHADICRTVSVGNPSNKQKQAFDIYLKAQRMAVQAAGPNTTMTKVENIMHSVFEKEGYEENFVGPPIHGVGLEFEEPPLPAGHAFFHGEEPKEDLMPGMVLAIGNCGLYFGEFGVRIEDTLAITSKGHEELTNFPRRIA